MVHILKVHKVNQPVDLSFDEGGLRIEGDLNAAKTCNLHFNISLNFLSNTINKNKKKSQRFQNCVLHSYSSWKRP
jgi:hypothetical protein